MKTLSVCSRHSSSYFLCHNFFQTNHIYLLQCSSGCSGADVLYKLTSYLLTHI